MVATQHEIEAIVREVLRRLSNAGVLAPPTMAAPPAQAETERAAPGELRLDRRVVTMAALEGVPENVRRLIVPRGALVTPAVQDELRNRGVELGFATSAGNSPQTTDGQPRLFVGTGAVKTAPVALERSIREDHRGAEFFAADCLIRVTRKVVETISGGQRLGLIVTNRPAVAICLANRAPAVRAVWGTSVPLVAEAAKTIGPNLLVVHPVAHSLHELRSMIRDFVQGNHACPETWQAALNGGWVSDPTKTSPVGTASQPTVRQ